jgi:hypothetical protein
LGGRLEGRSLTAPLGIGATLNPKNPPNLKAFQSRARSELAGMPRSILLALAGLAVLVTAMACWYQAVAQRDAGLSAEVSKLEKEWAEASSNLDDARKVQEHVRAFLAGAARVEGERGNEHWTTALRSIAINVGPDVEIWTIHLWKDPQDYNGRLLHIEGAATGASPRLVADKFLQGLREELMRQFKNAERTKFERIDETGESANLEGGHRITFAIAAPIGAPIAASGGKPKNQP